MGYPVLHNRLVFLHRSKQLELSTGTFEVVARPLYFEIGIALQKIGEEA